MCATENTATFFRNLRLLYDSAANGIIQVMIQIGHNICDPDNPAFHCIGRFSRVVRHYFSESFGVFQNSIPHFISKVKTFTVALKDIDNAQALSIVRKLVRIYFLSCNLAPVTEGRVSKIMAKRNSFGQVLIQA